MANVINSLTKKFLAQPDPATLINEITALLIPIQYRKRERLLDSDDIGEFVAEVEFIRSLGGESLTCLIACPAKVANSYKGRCESTVLVWSRESDGSERVYAYRKEQMSIYRYKAVMPNNSPLPYAYKWTSTKGVNIAAR